MANDRPREIIDSPKSPIVPTRSSAAIGNWSWCRCSIAVSLAFSLASLWGVGSERRVLDQRNRCVSAHGKGRSADAAGLHAAHPLQVVLSGEKRPALDVSANAGPVEVVS